MFENETEFFLKSSIFGDITPCSQQTFRRKMSPSLGSKNKPSKKPACKHVASRAEFSVFIPVYTVRSLQV
jgi:hypothetical protein